MLLSPCGIDCETCKDYGICGGCRAAKGKPFHIRDYGMEICPHYDCAVNKWGYQTCGECPGLPCRLFYELVDPSVAEETQAAFIDERVRILKAFPGMDS